MASHLWNLCFGSGKGLYAIYGRDFEDAECRVSGDFDADKVRDVSNDSGEAGKLITKEGGAIWRQKWNG